MNEVAGREEEKTFISFSCEHVPDSCSSDVALSDREEDSAQSELGDPPPPSERLFLGTWLPHREGRLEKLRSIKLNSSQTQRLRTA